jgi:hypothetical protein
MGCPLPESVVPESALQAASVAPASTTPESIEGLGLRGQLPQSDEQVWHVSLLWQMPSPQRA